MTTTALVNEKYEKAFHRFGETMSAVDASIFFNMPYGTVRKKIQVAGLERGVGGFLTHQVVNLFVANKITPNLQPGAWV